MAPAHRGPPRLAQLNPPARGGVAFAMPYPETCPECAGPFRNTGTHFTARRNEVGRKVMLELGCQNVSRRFWWDFTQGTLAGGDGRNGATRDLVAAQPAAATVTVTVGTNGTNGHVVHEDAPSPASSALASPATSPPPSTLAVAADPVEPAAPDVAPGPVVESAEEAGIMQPMPEPLGGARATFLRQLALDRLMLRQMRGWLLSEDARRAAEVAAGATEAAYERLAIALFGSTLAELLGPNVPTAAPTPTVSAEERLEQQREKARIRARQRRAALKRASES